MIQFTCPNCRSKLQAKAALVGQVRKCPKCATPVRIMADAPVAAKTPAVASVGGGIPVDDVPPDQHVILPTEEHLPVHRPPTRLNRESHYLICDRTQLVAVWENNGKGWMLRSGSSFISAKRNRDRLPAHGEFQLVELKFSITPEGKRLVGLTSFQLANHWALTVLDQGDDLIFEKVAGPGCLNRDQKSAVRFALREQFMRPVWEHATEVLDYLGSADYHAHGVGP
jgi:hypothetical protein